MTTTEDGLARACYEAHKQGIYAPSWDELPEPRRERWRWVAQVLQRWARQAQVTDERAATFGKVCVERDKLRRQLTATTKRLNATAMRASVVEQQLAVARRALHERLHREAVERAPVELPTLRDKLAERRRAEAESA